MEHTRGRLAVFGGLMGALLTGALFMAGASSAAPADPVSDAFDDLNAKVALYGGATVVLVVAAIVILFGIKWLKKGAGKA